LVSWADFSAQIYSRGSLCGSGTRNERAGELELRRNQRFAGVQAFS
jgi:hypothetical protein